MFKFLKFVLILSFVLLSISASDTEYYDEVAKFNEVLHYENPLIVIFTEECCRCTECVEAETLLGGMSKDLEDSLNALIIRLKKPDLRQRYGIKNIPALVYIRKNKTAIYDGKFELDALYSWLQENLEPATFDLDDNSFEHLTQAATGATTGDWLVMFHDGKCCKNRELLHLENAGVKLRNRVNVANVNIKQSPETVERFRIQKCPSVIYFRHQKMYRFSLPDVTSAALIRFTEGFYKNSKTESVPLPPSSFDKFVDKFILKSKEVFINYWYALLVIVALTTVFTTILLICAVLQPASHKKKE